MGAPRICGVVLKAGAKKENTCVVRSRATNNQLQTYMLSNKKLKYISKTVRKQLVLLEIVQPPSRNAEASA
jgi:tRNA G18 (ribose-2'-O)-methylase SpoU